jgi:hypothetical protein
VPAAAQAASLGAVAGDTVTYATREICKVPVDGVDETWTLRWRNRPRRESGSKTEEGSLEVARAHPGAPLDTLLLDGFFADGVAKLFDYAWADVVLRSDPGLDSCGLVTMHLADYDHDGRATEFVVKIGQETERTPSIVVGISRVDPRLHAFGTRADPNHPLVLANPWDWGEVESAGGPVPLLQTECAEGARYEETVIVRFAGGVFDVKRKKIRCR